MPAVRAAFSTEAPQAKASSSTSSVFFLVRATRCLLAHSAAGSSRTGFAPSLLTGELLPPGHDHIAVKRVELHEEGAPSCLLGGDQGRAAAAKEVQDVLPRARGVRHG